MRLYTFFIQLAVLGKLSSAFSPLQPCNGRISLDQARGLGRLSSSQWDDEDEDVTTEDKPRSFDEAGAGLQAEDDQKRMEEMGNFDANPSVSKESFLLVRRIVR